MCRWIWEKYKPKKLGIKNLVESLLLHVYLQLMTLQNSYNANSGRIHTLSVRQ